MDQKAERRSIRTGSDSNVAAPDTDSRADVPLYLQVAHTLKEEIVTGVHPVGSLLPTEGNLCKRFSVSRYTVREALKLLRDDGLVSSRQGAGTVVIPPSISSSDVHQVMSINDLVAFGIATRFVIDSMKMVAIDSRIAAMTGLVPGEEWLQVRGYRQAEGTEVPVCWVEFYINRAFAGVGRLLQRHDGPIFVLIEDMFGLNIVEVNQQISAAIVSPALATALKVEPGSAVLEIRRAYKTADGTTVQITVNTHPAASFQHTMTMRRVRS